MKYLIIGGGPAGLGAAWQLNKLGADWNLVEANDYLGGLSASFRSADFTWDLGVHVLYSHYEYFDNVLDSFMKDEDWFIHRRNAVVRIYDSWMPYPFQANIRRLPQKVMHECLEGLIISSQARQSSPPRNFADWILSSSGAGIAKHFMMPYNKKI